MQLIIWIIIVLCSLGAGYWVYRSDKKRLVPKPWVTATLRSIVVFLTLLLLLLPAITIHRQNVQKPIVVYLQDASTSIPDALKKDSANYRKHVDELLDKLSKKNRVVKWSFGAAVREDSLFRYDQQATDISSALARVQEYYGQQNLGAVILASDGRFNQGSNPQYQNLSLKGSLYTVAIGDSAAQKDLRITQVYANRNVSLNSQFEIRADLIGTLCNGHNGSLQLQEAGKGVLNTTPVSIPSDQFDRSYSFSVKAETPGLHHYIITTTSADGEQNVSNNRKDVFVDVVDEKKKILILAAAPHPDINAIREALSSMEGYEIIVRMIDNIPSSIQEYSMVILHELPSRNFVLPQQLQQVKKPIWYIIGALSNLSSFNQFQKAATINMNPAKMQDALPAIDPAFNSFMLPQNIAAVFDKLPPLSVPTGNVATAPTSSNMVVQRVNGSQSPLWVLQSGNPATALLMGEGLWRWRIYEYRNFGTHTVIDECIRQTISFLGINNIEKPFRTELAKYAWSDQEAIKLNAFLLNANNEQVNTPEVQLTITDSAGHKQKYSFERNGSNYQLNIGIRAGGTYNYSAQTTYNGKTYTSNGSFIVESVPLEKMQSGADYRMLYSLAHKNGGSLIPSSNVQSLYDSIQANKNIQPLIQAEQDTAPLVNWKWFFFLIVAVAVSEWLLRKYWMAQ